MAFSRGKWTSERFWAGDGSGEGEANGISSSGRSVQRWWSSSVVKSEKMVSSCFKKKTSGQVPGQARPGTVSPRGGQYTTNPENNKPRKNLLASQTNSDAGLSGV